ncbi:MAG: HD domain-containing protein [Myxococcales bacterium]|nr:MAG: HD domain-containing protein [Myxococcales bacterium]
MCRLLTRLRDIHDALPFWQRMSTDRAQDALAAALLHDVGHGPLSHLFESALPRVPHHEHWSSAVLLDPSTEVHRALAQGDPGRPARVAELIHGRHELPYLAHAVSGALDVDRCDYLLRDAHATGVRYGDFDLGWLLRSLRFGLAEGDQAPSLAVDGHKGLVAIEEFLLSRFFMFQQVYFHKSTRAAECMIRAALALAVEALIDGETLPGVPAALVSAARGGDVSLGDYLELDDASIWGALHAWEDARHPVLRDLCRRVRARSLFKTVELVGELAEPGPSEEALHRAQEIAGDHGVHEGLVFLDIASDVPISADDEPPLVVLSNGDSRPLHEVSFLLGRLFNATFTRVRLVFPAELREPMRRAFGS